MELGGAGLTRLQRAQFDRFVAFEHAATDAGRGERNLNQVRDCVAGVENGDERVIRFSGTDGARMREGERELRIAHQHRPGGFAFDLHGARGQTFKVGDQIEVHDVQPFLQTFDQEFALAALTGLEPADVIGRSDLAVRTGTGDRLCWLNDFVWSNSSKAERVIARMVVVCCRNLIGPGRQVERGLHVDDAEAGALRRAVLSKDLHAENLVEEPDPARHNHQRWNGRDLEGEILVLLFDHLEIDSLNIDINARGFQFFGQLHRRRDIAIDIIGRRQFGRQLRRWNNLRRSGEGRRHHREFHRNRFPIQHKPDLELDRVEIIFVDDDAPFLYLIERERPRRDARDQDIIENVDGHPIGIAFHPRDAGGGIDELNVIQFVITDERQWRQEQRRIDLSDHSSSRERRPAQRRLDEGAVRERGCRGAVGGTAADQFDQDRAGDAFGNGENQRCDAELSAGYAVFQGRQRTS